MSDFLPNNYSEPTTSNYMDFQDGENTFRILGNFADGSARMGYEYWTNKLVDGEMKPRPVRVKEEDQIPLADVLEGKYGLQLYFFWAIPVYNFDAKRIQLLVIKQKSVRRAITTYLKNPKWGDPHSYNFVVSKFKIGDKTEYEVSVEPKELLDKSITERYENMKIDMDEWMKSNDPFMSQKDENEVSKDPKSDQDQFIKDVEDSVREATGKAPF